MTDDAEYPRMMIAGYFGKNADGWLVREFNHKGVQVAVGATAGPVRPFSGTRGADRVECTPLFADAVPATKTALDQAAGRLMRFLDGEPDNVIWDAPPRERLRLYEADLRKVLHGVAAMTAILSDQSRGREVRSLLEESRDLLLELRRGNPARSPAHNARLTIQQALNVVDAGIKRGISYGE
jgi:hypothetical protein